MAILHRRRFQLGILAPGVTVALSGGHVFAQEKPAMLPPGTSLGIRSVPNLRDLGGYRRAMG
jgi:hypothetical protein